jgi:hypothetical protein
MRTIGQTLSRRWFTAENAVLRLFGDVPAGLHMLGTFEKLARGGSTPGELAGYSRRLRDTFQSPGGPVLIMRRQATQILCRQPARDPADTLRLVEQVTCGDVASAASDLYQHMIVATPQLIPAVQGRMPRLPLWSAVPVAGGVTYRRQDSAVTLTLADEGVMLTAEPGKFAAVRSDQVAALLKWSDAKLTLIGTDGFALQLDPADWDGAGDALQVLAHRTDPDLVVTIDAPGPARGKPAAPDPAPPGPAAATTPQALPALIVAGIRRRTHRPGMVVGADGQAGGSARGTVGVHQAAVL